ncbi:MAG: SPOR domain-containing protein [Deltaproteobacteria bacterium]|nr:MAG: SPOR domain-containing protein [Deltaproteobacteria bacterium]
MRTAAGAALFVVAGFGIGLVVGIAWEDPSLVAGHIAGRTEAVPLASLEEVEPAAGDVPAATATAEPAPAKEAPAAPAPRATAPPPEPPPQPAPAPVGAPGPPSRSEAFWIQVGSFTEPSQAEELRDALRAKGFSVRVSSGTVGDVARWRVRVGPAATRAEAERLAARLKSQERLPTWVVSKAKE